MTILADLLGRRGRRPAEPMGFGRAAAAPARVPDILLLGRLGPPDLPDLGGVDLSRAPFAAVVLEMPEPAAEALEAASGALGEAVWGVRTPTVRQQDVEALKRAGADFAIFGPAGTDGAVLVDEELGKFLTIEAGLDDDASRAVQALPLDGVAMDVDAGLFPLTVESILDLHVAVTSGANAVVFSDFDPGALSAGDLEALRGCGVAALALPALPADRLEGLAEAIWQMPEPRPVEDETVALVPPVGAAGDCDH